MRVVLALCLLLGCAQTTPGGEPDDVDGGPPAGDGGAGVDAAAGPLDRSRLEGLVLRFGPVLFLHPQEAYLPSSTDWFLARAGLFKDSQLIQDKPSPVGLPTKGDGFYLSLPAASRGGDLASAIAYVHGKVTGGGSTTDLQFWFFYPYNGPGTLAITTPLVSFDTNLSPFGEHTGDWEHVTLRIDNATETLAAVYLAQHNGGEWIMDPMKSMELEGRRPIVYSSKNGHAAYRAVGPNLSETGSQVGIDYGLRNDTGRGMRLDCAVRYRIVADSEAPFGFIGRWGPRIDNAPFINQVVGSVPVVGKAIVMTTLAKETISDGPTSPGQRSTWTGDE